MKKNTITRAEYLQLLGLTIIANRACAEIKRLIEAAQAIVGEDSKEYGHIDDLMWSDQFTVDEILRKLEIKVEAEKPTGGSAVEPVILDERGPNERQGYILWRMQGAQREEIPLNPEAADLVRDLLKQMAPSAPPEDLRADS